MEIDFSRMRTERRARLVASLRSSGVDVTVTKEKNRAP